MKVFKEMTLADFPTWGGAESVKEKIIEADKADEFDRLIEELYPDGIEDTTLNDILWFDETLLESLGIYREDE